MKNIVYILKIAYCYIDNDFQYQHYTRGEKLMNHVLIVEDDQHIADIITIYLENQGYQSSWASDVPLAKESIKNQKPDLIILDIMLPGIDGLSFCKWLRSYEQLPIMMISAKANIKDRVEALNFGADDYLVKPFSMQELIARVNALLRRCDYRKETTQNPSNLFTINESKRQLFVHDKEIPLTAYEYELFKLFMNSPGRVFTRDELLTHIRGVDKDLVTERAIDVHITNLRKKIEPDHKKPTYIKTVWGVGYKFSSEDS